MYRIHNHWHNTYAYFKHNELYFSISRIALFGSKHIEFIPDGL